MFFSNRLLKEVSWAKAVKGEQRHTNVYGIFMELSCNHKTSPLKMRLPFDLEHKHRTEPPMETWSVDHRFGSTSMEVEPTSGSKLRMRSSMLWKDRPIAGSESFQSKEGTGRKVWHIYCLTSFSCTGNPGADLNKCNMNFWLRRLKELHYIYIYYIYNQSINQKFNISIPFPFPCPCPFATSVLLHTAPPKHSS